MYHLTPPAWGVCGKVFDLASVFVTVLRRVMLTVPFARGGQERDPLSKQQVGLAAAVQSVVAGGPVTVSFFFRTLESRVTSLPTTDDCCSDDDVFIVVVAGGVRERPCQPCGEQGQEDIS